MKKVKKLLYAVICVMMGFVFSIPAALSSDEFIFNSDDDVAALSASDASDASDHFDPATLQFLQTNTGLNAEQWDNIMKLVNKPEQDSLSWWNYYGYCENINDGRGYTIGIFGATTGGPNDTGPDGPALFKEYDKVCGASNPSTLNGVYRIGVPKGKATFKNGILTINESKSTFYKQVRALQNNANWRTAMWHTFYNVYIKYSIEQAHQRGFTSALAIGSFVDTALNQGGNDSSTGSLKWILGKVGNISGENAFLKKFYTIRKTVVDDPEYEFNQYPNGQNRVKQWSTLLSKGEMDIMNCNQLIKDVTSWTME